MGLFDEQLTRKPNNYPETDKFIEAFHQSFWTEAEFSFKGDISQFKSELTEEEREVVKRSLSAIAQIEVAVKTFWGKLGDNLRQPSIVDLGYVMANSEVIHNRAYEKLLVLLQLQEVFEDNLKEDVIRGRVNYLKKYLDKNYEDQRKQYIYSIALFTLFVENVSLFSQFYTLLALNRFKGVLKDTAQQIQYTQNEECYHPSTEVLTPSGWKRIDEFKEGDTIYQYNPVGNLEETKVIRTVKKPFFGSLIKIETGDCAAIVTPGHNMVVFDSIGHPGYYSAKDMTNTKRYVNAYEKFFRISAPTIATSHKLMTEEEKFSVFQFFLAEETSNFEGYTKFDLTKLNHLSRLELLNLCDKLKLDYLASQDNSIFVSSSLPKFEEFIFDIDLNSDWPIQFVSYIQTYMPTPLILEFKTAELVNQAHTIITAAGRRMTITGQTKGILNTTQVFNFIQNLSDSDFNYSGDVYCVTVPSGMIQTRILGKTMICGNCLHAQVGIYLINTLRSEYPELFDEELEKRIVSEAEEAVIAEGKIIDWILQDYELENLSKPILKAFLKNRLKQSLADIGFPTIELTEEEKVLLEKTEWFEEETIGKSLTDFFHKRPVDYAKNFSAFDLEDIFK